jgi:CheY-like chemotaxis protein
MASILALKEVGTSPPAQGMLSKFAEIREIRSTKEVTALANRRFDIVLIDTSMPRIEPQRLVQALRSTGLRSRPVILLLDFNEPPAALRRRLDHLAKLDSRAVGKPLDLRTTVRLLRISQETLARMLHVSSRSAHRWLHKTRPRRSPELQRLQCTADLLVDTLGTEQAIQQYLNQPNASLDGQMPITFLTRGEFDRVDADLESIREGVYV